jgi:DNA-binding transcriptional regulator PaaX
MESSINTKEVLKIIGVTGLLISSIYFPGLPAAVYQIQKYFKNANKKRVKQILKRLEKQELIKIEEHHNTIKIAVTERGRQKLLQFDLDDLRIKNKKHDGKLRIIMFDIPEYKKLNRDYFREKLVQIGCVWMQDSVYINPFKCNDELDFLCQYFDVSNHVTMFLADKIERGEKITFA